MMRTWLRRSLAAAGLLALALAGDLAWLVHSQATVTTSANKVVIAGNGSQTAFAFSFVGVAASDIVLIVTTAAGVQTTISPALYSVALTAAAPGALWGIGGTVTYPLSGSPVPAGSTVTLLRTLPLTQATSLQNQASFGQLAAATEKALDLLAMQVQQVSTLVTGAVVQPPTDACTLAAMPAAAQRANGVLGFDSTGCNPTIVTTVPAGTISSAMQPVVNAGSLAAGRTALGLGSMALENINGGTCGGTSIQDDGSAGGANGVGFARVVYATTSDVAGQSVTCAFHNQQRIATGPITYTLPRASTTLFNGFRFRVFAFTGTITFTPNAADNFKGQASGTSVAIAPGTACWLTTDAAGSATWLLDCTNATPTLSANASASALTLTLSAPALVFRDTTLANGDPFWALPAGGVSITIPSGASLGTSSSNVPFRVWIFAAYNGGTPILGVATCSGATATTAAIYPCSAWETIQKSGTAITSGATALGTLYTSAGTTNDAVRIIGYADYASGLTTAGTWASSPTTLQVCLAPFRCKLPGDVVQSVFAQSSSTTITAAITPTSTSNLVRFSAFLSATTGSGAAQTTLYKRASTTLESQTTGNGATGTVLSVLGTVILDAPGSVSSLTYSTSSSGGGISVTQESIVLDEIMG